MNGILLTQPLVLMELSPTGAISDAAYKAALRALAQSAGAGLPSNWSFLPPASPSVSGDLIIDDSAVNLRWRCIIELVAADFSGQPDVQWVVRCVVAANGGTGGSYTEQSFTSGWKSKYGPAIRKAIMSAAPGLPVELTMTAPVAVNATPAAAAATLAFAPRRVMARATPIAPSLNSTPKMVKPTAKAPTAVNGVPATKQATVAKSAPAVGAKKSTKPAKSGKTAKSAKPSVKKKPTPRPAAKKHPAARRATPAKSARRR